jgi:hypothetical protein
MSQALIPAIFAALSRYCICNRVSSTSGRIRPRWRNLSTPFPECSGWRGPERGCGGTPRWSLASECQAISGDAGYWTNDAGRDARGRAAGHPAPGMRLPASVRDGDSRGVSRAAASSPHSHSECLRWRVSFSALTRMARSPLTGHSCSHTPQPMQSLGSTCGRWRRT